MSTTLKIQPPESPAAADLADAIQKGLGRALLWARNGLWTDRAILLDACLHDLRHDRQIEEARGLWLWQIMEAASVIDAFRGPILDSLFTVDDGLAGQQLCQLAVFYAQSGDERFRLLLQEIVAEKPDPSYPSLGEMELIELDGVAGFLFAARLRGEALASRDWDWEDGWLIEEAIDQLGEVAVLTCLECESPTSPALKRLYDGWRASKAARAQEPRTAHAERMRQIPLSTAIQAAEAEQGQAGILRGWGMYADEADLRIARDRLQSTREPAITVNYLRIFSNRPLPDFSERFLQFLDHEDEEVRARAFTALAQNTHPAIRRYAVDHLHQRLTERNFLELFIRNFRPGDERMLLEVLHLPNDEGQRHGFLMDLRKILEHNPDAKCQKLGQIIYRWTPCGSCRHDAVRLLLNRQVAPGWLLQECRHDAVADTRGLVGTP